MQYKDLGDLESVVENLGKIAKGYSCTDTEYGAILLATYALIFVQKSKLELAFKHFFEEQNAPPTDEQIEFLKRKGFWEQ